VPSTSKSAAQAAKEAMPFEEALRKLESIVEAMEAGDLPLETLLARFEEGMRLLKTCQTRLQEAELKIQQLEKKPAGDVALKPLALESAADAP
jgi:exodeoxyribonuclease VII small subunit